MLKFLAGIFIGLSFGFAFVNYLDAQPATAMPFFHSDLRDAPRDLTSKDGCWVRQMGYWHPLRRCNAVEYPVPNPPSHVSVQ